MKLLKVQAQNFLSLKDVNIDLDNKGLVLIKGKNLDNTSIDSNGSGKSSIVEALVYALYGRTIRGLKGDSVIHKLSKKNMKVALVIEDDNGDLYLIERYRKHSTYKTKSYIYKNDTDITPKSELDLNTFISDLIQMDYLTFTSSLLYTAESFKFTSASDAQIKSTFEKMLGLDVFSKCQEITKDRLKSIANEIESSNWKLEEVKSSITKINDVIASAQNNSKTFIATKANKIKEIEETILKSDKKLKLYEADLAKTNNILKTAKEDLINHQKRYEEQENSVKQIEAFKDLIKDEEIESKNIEHTIELKNQEINLIDTQIKTHVKSLSKLDKEIKDLVQKEVDLLSTIGTECPTCGNILTEDSIKIARKSYDERIQVVSDQIDEGLATVKLLYKDIEQLKKDIKGLEKSLTEKDSSIQKYKKILDSSNNTIEKLETIKNDFNKANLAVQETQIDITSIKGLISSTVHEKELYTKNLKELKEEVNPYNDIVTSYKKELEIANDKILKINEKFTELETQKAMLEFINKAYSNQGIKSLILDSITPYLNTKVNEYLSKLSSGHIEVEFNTVTTLKSGEQREKFNIVIHNKDGGQDYMSNSTGEKKRIDLAVNLALQDLVASRSNKSLNIVVLDEALDGLDQSGVETVIDLLNYLSSKRSSIFVISHNPHLQSVFNSTLTVVKNNGYSEIKDGE